MKQLTSKRNIFYIIIAIIMLAGILVICTAGFNLGITYSESKRIDVYIGKDFKLNDIKNITKEIFDQKVVLQTAEILDDYVSITVKDASEEQIENLKTKIVEKYNISENLQKVTITNIPSTDVIDVMKPYGFPILLATLIFTCYLAIRFRQQGILKVCAKTIIGLMIVEALYFSIIAITRIPFNDLIMPIALLIYIIATICLVCGLKSDK